MSFLASATLLVPGTLLLSSYCFYAKKKKEAILVLVGFYGGVALSYSLKRIFQIARPEDHLVPIDGYSFPSGHAMSAVIFYSLLAFIIGKEIKNKSDRLIFIIANIVIILLVGLSRVMLKVHYLTDVIGGYLIGLLWLFVIYKILGELNEK